MTISIMSRTLIKFGPSQMMCVELRAKKLSNVYCCHKCMYMHVNCSYSHVQNTPQPRHQSMKLRIMTISIMSRVLIKFRPSQMLCVELRAKKLSNVYCCHKCMYMHVNCSYSHVQNTPQPHRQSIKLRIMTCLLYTSPSPRDATLSRMPSSA